ncbi:hypothetical protein GW17_00018099 [Ensete ventricosum]|nr:hypothetical protein GW17_00018099 [Ensete ventricosum]
MDGVCTKSKLWLVDLAGSERLTKTDVQETVSSLNFASRVRGVELGLAKKQVDTVELQKMKQMKTDRFGKNSAFSSVLQFVHDAPFAAAIGACVLNSLVFPISADETEDEDGGGTIDATDARFAVMGIISFIPYFNWLVSLLKLELFDFLRQMGL